MKTRAEIFEEYLTQEKQYIVYNGVMFTLLDADNNTVIHCENPDELFTFIKGFNLASRTLIPVIEELKQNNQTLNNQNVTNIERYEKIIMDMGKEAPMTPANNV